MLSRYGWGVREELVERAARYAAMGEPVRAAIVDTLYASDRSPQEMQVLFDISSNLLAHHLDVLEQVGLISRGRSSGDGRRRYIHLHLDVLASMHPSKRSVGGRALFICTANSARSQLAAALWTQIVGEPATSAGTHPAERVHPEAVAAARRAGLDLTAARPRALGPKDRSDVVITVCDRAHEELAADPSWLHWSIPDPVDAGTKAAFDRTIIELRSRIEAVAA
jgi:ArsR family transcriptional regulator, arsenate/arsenite/antimonite-responsive transcriptional repressor / arsenate reductase (thioredoxin)